MATTAKAEEQEAPASEAPDAPLLDLSDQAVKRLIKIGKTRGFITYDELNEVLPSEEVSSEQIEDIMAMLSDIGINVVEADEVEEADAGPIDDEEEDRGTAAALPVAKQDKSAEPTD